MAPTTISIDVFCNQTPTGNSIYRVYVDNDLLTERNWIWSAYDTYIKEHIEVNLEPGNHVIRLDNCNTPNNFTFKNVTVNKQVIDSTNTWNDYSFSV